MNDIIFIISLIGLVTMILSVPTFWINRIFVKGAKESEFDIKVAFAVFCTGVFLFGFVPMISDFIRWLF